MPRPKQQLAYQATVTPTKFALTLDTLKTCNLNITGTKKRRLNESELSRVKGAIESVLENNEHVQTRAQYSDAVQRAESLTKAASGMIDAIKAFRALDDRGTVTAQRLQFALGMVTKEELTRFVGQVRALSKEPEDDLIGPRTDCLEVWVRDRLGAKLLEIFEDASGEIKKTKSKSGNSSSIAANWLVDVGTAIREDNSHLHHLTFETIPSAEELVVKYAKTRKGS